MAKATRICKICGKEYNYCKTYLPSAFRWQDVACCMEHAQEYFSLIEATRAESAPKEAVVAKQVAEEAESTEAPAEGVKKVTRRKRASKVVEKATEE